MSTISITLTPGYQFIDDELVTIAKLNQLGQPAVDLVGAIGTLSLNDGSVTTAKLANNAIAASSTGRGKMQDGFFADDATSRAKFAAGFFPAGDATALAFFDDGFVTGHKLAANAAGLAAAARNLVVKYVSATTVDIDADELLLKDANGLPFLAQAVNLTVDITASGANGLDAGAEGASTWYYLWVIYNPTTTTVASLISAAATGAGLALPADYTHYALVGAVRNDGSSNFVTFYQQDRAVWLNETVIFTNKAAAQADTWETYQAGAGSPDVDLRTVVPPYAKILRGNAGGSVSGNDHGIAVAANTAGLGAVNVIAGRIGPETLNSFTVAGAFAVPLQTAQQFAWKSYSTNARGRITITGYTI